MRLVDKTLYYSRKFASRPSFYTMKVIGRVGFARPIITRLSNRHLSPPQTRTTSIFEDLNVEAVVRDLRRDGLALGIHLPVPIVHKIRRYAEEAYCYGNAHPEFGYPCRSKAEAEDIAGQRFVVGNYFNTASDCPAIRDLERDPKLWQIAAGYFGTTPRHIGNQLWWSYAGERTQEEKNSYAQLYHFDLDDYIFLKFFFYLTDVNMDSGPHVCIRGSHRRKRLRDALRYQRIADENVLAFYGPENIITMTGAAGTGFAEDTYCIHKGISPRNQDRLILQIQFALNDYGVQHDEKPRSELKALL